MIIIWNISNFLNLIQKCYTNSQVTNGLIVFAMILIDLDGHFLTMNIAWPTIF